MQNLPIPRVYLGMVAKQIATQTGKLRNASFKRVTQQSNRETVSELGIKPEYTGSVATYIFSGRLPNDKRNFEAPFVNCFAAYPAITPGTTYGPDFELANNFHQFSNGHLITC